MTIVRLLRPDEYTHATMVQLAVDMIYAETYDGRFDPLFFLKTVTDLMNQGYLDILVEVHETIKRGAVGICRTQSLFTGLTEHLVLFMVVHPDHRGGYVLRHLFSALHERYRHLHVSTTDPRMKTVLRKSGYAFANSTYVRR